MPLPQFLKTDLPRKLVALFFAALIWGTVDQQLNDEIVLHNVPVALQYDKGAVLLDDETITVDVTLRGSRKRLESILTSDVQVRAAVPTLQPGLFFYELRITPAHVRTPTGVKAVEITPSQHQLHVDRIVAKENVPIRVRFDGQLPEGYKRARVSVYPSVVDIRGPSRILRDMNQMVTEPVVLSENVTQDFEEDIRLVAVPQVRASTEKVHVAIEITRHSSQQAFRDLDMNVLYATDSALQLAKPPPKVAVTLHGPKVTLDTLDRLSIRPFIDLTAITSPGRYRRPVQVWIDGAANVTAEYVHPSVVELVLTNKPPPPAKQATQKTPAPPPPKEATPGK